LLRDPVQNRVALLELGRRMSGSSVENRAAVVGLRRESE
jgi:hypothetical protein